MVTRGSHSQTVVWHTPISVLAQAVAKQRDGIRSRAMQAAHDIAGRMQAHMKATHPWQNRTGAAERGLTCQAFLAGEGVQIVCYHTVPYGVFLELRWAGRFAVIWPTMMAFNAEIMTAMQRAIVE